MQRLRSRFPRVEISRYVLVFCALVVIAGGVVFWFSRSAEEATLEDQSFATGLEQVSQQRRNAIVADDLMTSWTMLNEARAQLDKVATLTDDGANDPRVIAERVAIDEQLNRLSGMERVTNVQAVGAVPVASEGVTSRLIAGEGRVYLLSDAIYQIDVAGSALVLLLQPGDVVDGEPVETLRAAAWRENRLMVLDARRAYIFDPTTGGWNVERLGTFDSEGFTDVAAGATFDFNLYLLATRQRPDFEVSGWALREQSRRLDWWSCQRRSEVGSGHGG